MVDFMLLPDFCCVDNAKSTSEDWIESSVTAKPEPSKRNVLFGDMAYESPIANNEVITNNDKNPNIIFTIILSFNLVYNLLLNYFRHNKQIHEFLRNYKPGMLRPC